MRVIGTKEVVDAAAIKDGFPKGELKGKVRDREKTTVLKIEKPTEANYIEAGLNKDSKEELYCYTRPKNWKPVLV